MRISLAHCLVRCACLAISAIAVPSLPAQTSSAPSTVVVAIFDDYPVFKERFGRGINPSGELRAMVILRDYADQERSVVILNPASVTPEVLYTALGVLQSASTQLNHANLIGITRRGTPRANALPQAARSLLSATIAELQSVRPSTLRGHQRGKHITLAAAVHRMIAEVPSHPRP